MWQKMRDELLLYKPFSPLFRKFLLRKSISSTTKSIALKAKEGFGHSTARTGRPISWKPHSRGWNGEIEFSTAKEKLNPKPFQENC